MIRALHLNSLCAADEERWDRFVFNHPQGTFFHLSGWKRVLERTFGHKAYYAYCEENGEIVGIAPLFSVSNWLVGRCLVSVPLAASGGIIANSAEQESFLLEHAIQFAQSQSVDYLELRNQTGNPYQGFHANSLYAAFRGPLFRDPETNLKRLPKDTRYMIRKAEKAGLRVEHGIHQVGTFYNLFAESMRRLGTPVFPRSLFRNFLEQFPKHTHLLIVYNGSEPLGGVMSFFFRDVILPYYSGAVEHATRMAGNNFMYWELIKWAGEQGFGTFDFGRSKRGTGAYAFKTQWNMPAEPLNYQTFLVKRRTVPNFSPVNPKFEAAIRIWQKLPLPVTKFLGPSLVRLFP